MSRSLKEFTWRESEHMHKLLDAMLNHKTVWVPHYTEGWEPTTITNITRAGSVTVVGSNSAGFWACKSSDVRLRKPPQPAGG